MKISDLGLSALERTPELRRGREHRVCRRSTDRPESWIRTEAAPTSRRPTMAAVTLCFVAICMLAATQASDAKIVYAPVNVTIENSTYNLDLNNDGNTDFVISESNTSQGPGKPCTYDVNFYGSLTTTANPKQRAAVEGTNGLALALSSGSPIGQGQDFLLGTVVMEQDSTTWHYTFEHGCFPDFQSQGNWYNVNRYLGLAFVIRGRRHYGWAQLDVASLPSNPALLTATLTGYAYQTTAGKSILAGQK
jgi:hypothetical protein